MSEETENQVSTVTAPRRPSPNPVFDITHPNYPSIVVQGRHLTQNEQMEERDYLQQFQRAVSVVDSNGNPCYEKDGTLASRVVQDFPPDYNVRYAKKTLAGWRGLKDESGEDIQFSEKNFAILSEDWLDVYEDWPADTPKKPSYKRRRSFAAHIGEVVRRPVSDPTTPRSA
jgi:hypothetical protein